MCPLSSTTHPSLAHSNRGASCRTNRRGLVLHGGHTTKRGSMRHFGRDILEVATHSGTLELGAFEERCGLIPHLCNIEVYVCDCGS